MTSTAASGAVPGTLPRTLPRSPLVLFAAVGGLTSLVWLAVYAVLQPHLGAQLANALSLLLTADLNTALNRRLTFGVSGREHARAQRLKGVLAYAANLAVTSAALAALSTAGITVGTAQTAGLLAAELVAGVLHFLLLRRWAFAAPPVTARAREDLS